MSLYPNPNDAGYVTIQTPVSGLKEVEVFDVIGKTVISTSLISDTMDVSELNPGIYMVRVTIDNQSNTSKLIIK